MSGATDAKQGIPLSELGMEQLSALQKQVEQELAFFQDSAAQLKTLLGKNDQSIRSLNSLENAPSGQSALIPLSESMYIPAQLSDPSLMLVEIGTGYFAEMARVKALQFFERKKTYIATQIETIEKIIVDKKRTRNIISENLQTKIQAQLSQLPTDVVK